MQFFTPAVANVLAADLIARADGTPITAGTVSFYLLALNGANAGKWFKVADSTWSATEQVAGTASHKADGHWTASILAAAWTSGVRYCCYAKESGDLHIAYSDTVAETAGAVDLTIESTITT